MQQHKPDPRHKPDFRHDDLFGDFGMDVVRKPAFMVDVEFHRLQLLAVKDLPSDITGWNHVPTPVF